MRSWIEVSGARLVENLRAVQAAAGDGVETLAVVKANGYGHGAAQVARSLAAAGVAWLGVSDVEEGVRLRAALGEDSTRILVMCGMEPGDAPAMVAHGLTPVVWNSEHVAAVERAASAAGSRTQVHVEVDTGMSRQGLPVGEPLAKLMAQLAAARWVSCEGVMSHLACAEDAGSALTALQRERFGVALQMASQAGLRPRLVHLGNSSAVDEGSTMAWLRETARAMGAQPMVRPGLALYGYALPVEGGAGALRLRPVLTWKTRIIGVREVAAGTTVGYGATFVAPSPLRLALLPVGYADGFRREASSGIGDGWVCIAGHRASVVGRVSMNLTTVDVTSLPVELGGEVVLLGEGVSAEDHARWCGTIPYEILCGLRARFQTL
jgi:alanine racemase